MNTADAQNQGADKIKPGRLRFVVSEFIVSS